MFGLLPAHLQLLLRTRWTPKKESLSLYKFETFKGPVPLRTQEGILIERYLTQCLIVNDFKNFLKKFFKFCKAYGFKELR